MLTKIKEETKTDTQPFMQFKIIFMFNFNEKTQFFLFFCFVDHEFVDNDNNYNVKQNKLFVELDTNESVLQFFLVSKTISKDRKKMKIHEKKIAPLKNLSFMLKQKSRIKNVYYV